MIDTPGNPNAVGRLPPAGVPIVGRVPAAGGKMQHDRNAASGDAACKSSHPASVGRLPPAGVPIVGRLPSTGVLTEKPTPRRLRRLHRVWPDRDGNISYLLTLCVDGRAPVLNNEEILQRLAAFLLDSPARYDWFGRRFVLMPDHLHLIAHMGHNAVPLGQWIKALKAVVGGLKPREEPGAESGDSAYKAKPVTHAGRVPSHGVPTPRPDDVGRLPSTGALPHEFTRIKRKWRWQNGFHDHKFRTPESEARKWEYICLNPVRCGLVQRPEEWPFGGEIFYDEDGRPGIVRGTPPMFETGTLTEDRGTLREVTRPTT